MNRKKLARRTALARQINQRWVLTRAMRQQLLHGLAMIFVTPIRMDVIKPGDVFPGGKLMPERFDFEAVE
jgi:hypothetical protein